MKLTFSKEEMENYRDTHADSLATVGYTQKVKLLRTQLPTYFLLIIDNQQITMIEQDWKLKEKGISVIHLSDINTLTVDRIFFQHRVKIKTTDKVYNLDVPPLNFGFKEYQNNLINRLKEISNNL
ncbi:hypothetical protein GIY11_04785 [Aerococcaceae bacterium DSM 109653]|uniref:YokE-like PH domain-containing protein n=1 Tax=Fundicoccus ignavus TaxID=2664442 RepID=A0A844BMC2_9LACT|nr:hypothetical protein [Fundicoccus ignavus]MRI81328.1 hypothetical protein [Fundicoccus ignavus]